MPDNIPKKLIGGFVGGVLILAGAYLLLSPGGNTASTASLETASSTAAEGEGASTLSSGELLQQLNQLREINIGTNLFNSPAFLQLQDFSVSISSQPVGRENPFLPPTYNPTGATLMPSEPVNQRPVSTDQDEATTTTDQSETATTTSGATTSSPTTPSSATASTTAATTTNEGAGTTAETETSSTTPQAE